jgi:hypothetical protein
MDQARVAIIAARIVEIDEITSEADLRTCRTTVANDLVAVPTKVKAKVASRTVRMVRMARQHRQHRQHK